ncbi:HTH domain-containing protein [Clostridium lacusfryxellense]|uniref:HTH domain-containing protein n=1 Tax=Clostridium lacusfryxellense TaxID=205328 RepID=UPI001C0E541E|nr:HTH domain-containing protein [Clostridium lacusfryxellense]MBU3114506.1 hypothetical protein [Clostridium lacusfryxellense]
MRKILFSEVNLLKLQKNKNILKVSKNVNTHTAHFKRLFIKKYISSKLPRDIFT